MTGDTPNAGAPLPSLLTDFLPISILTDSYKTTHYLQYPETTKMVAYGEFRCGFKKDPKDSRMVWYGIRYIIENYVCRRWTLHDVARADAFFATHMAPGQTAFPYPRHLFLKFIEENDGYMPVRIETLPEGTAIHAHVPVFQITAKGCYASLCTYLETLLVQCWYPVTVATLSRRCKDAIAAAFAISVDDEPSIEGNHPLLASRLHDFGFRGCTCVEQSVIGGAAHLLSFDGTDTLSAAYYVQYALNGGRPVGVSIPATEHSVMTAWPTERDAISNMIQKFGSGVFACVMDSYDYQRALDEVVPAVAAGQVAAGGFWVLRPDSGVPEDAVVAALVAAERTFGADVNSKGYKIPRGVGVIQGDGISEDTIGTILNAVLAAGYSAQSVAFGMGGGLLQRVDRDTMSFAVKLCHIVHAESGPVDVMKAPKGDPGKQSLPGVLAVKRVDGVPTAFPSEEVDSEDNLFKVVYDCGPVEGLVWDEFDGVRQRLEEEWARLPPTADVIAPSLRQKQKEVEAKLRAKG